MVRVCFVCLGNICRSPTAEGIFQRLVDEAGLGDLIAVDSAGTSAIHAGEPADARSRAEAERQGLRLTMRSRQFVTSDFRRFDYVLAMDSSNLTNLRAMEGAEAFSGTLTTLLSYDPDSAPGASVPDPYYGGPDGFSDVFELCERASRGLLAHLQTEHGLHAS